MNPIRGRSITQVVLVVAVLAGCDRGAEPPAKTAAADSSPGVVDSVFPMDVMLARFRAGSEEPSGLSSGAATRDELVREVILALEASDTLRFEQLAVNLPEYAWLYFPTAKVAQPPYELAPSLAWFRVQEGNRQGVFRALREMGGRKLEYRGYRCGAEPIVEGENRVWTECLVQVSREPGEPAELPIFGSILERGGRFAILSYGNDF